MKYCHFLLYKLTYLHLSHQLQKLLHLRSCDVAQETRMSYNTQKTSSKLSLGESLNFNTIKDQI